MPVGGAVVPSRGGRARMERTERWWFGSKVGYFAESYGSSDMVTRPVSGGSWPEKKEMRKGVAVGSEKGMSPVGHILFCLLAGAAVSWVGSPQAAEVYKCRTDAGLVYTDEPTSDRCRRLQLEVGKPDPEAIARLEKWKEQRTAEIARKAAETREERLVRVRELEALAAWQSARAAVMEAQAAQYCQYPQPVYFPLWTFPIAAPYFHDYSSFNAYPFWYGRDVSRHLRYGMPPARLHFSRKWR